MPRGPDMKLKTYTGEEIRELRRKLGMNQSEFWKIFMTTQSGGSRYESGREIPAPTQMLLNLAGSMPFPVEIDSTTNSVIGGTTPRS